MYDILRQNSSRVKNREISPLPFIYGPREDDTDTNNPPRRENFHRYGMVGTDWKFSRSFRFREVGGNDGKLFESTRLRGSDDPWIYRVGTGDNFDHLEFPSRVISTQREQTFAYESRVS